MVWVMLMKKRQNSPTAVLLLLLFLVGAVLGAVVSAGDTLPLWESYSAESHGFVLIWRAAQYFLLCGIFAFSGLGLVLIPGLFAVRGFVLSVTASMLLRSGGVHPELRVWVICGLPALVQLPGLLFAGRAGLLHSLALCRRSLGRRSPKYELNYRQAVLFACISCLLTALCKGYLVPVLLGLMS